MAAISTLVLSDNSSTKDRPEDIDSPTTPRPARFEPTSMNESRSLVVDPALQSLSGSTSTNSIPSSQGTNGGSLDLRHDDEADRRGSEEAMDMDDDEDDQAGSDNDADPDEDGSDSRKKKGQRFFCTGYPPCNLSFTRSEHLARHIRKHTGERPFQCHCNRRFSRLDNLRQHAQTVHVNEEIPTDSLAATGTRFQRQIRTDRVRPSGRPRTGTAGSTGGHSRGHSRNLSASSIGSTSSNYSMVTEGKRRPPPLLMASDSAGRSSFGLEPPQTPPGQYRGYNPGSPGSTPTSAHFSATPGSPGFLSSMTSPVSNNARLSGTFGSRTHARRLSVPSGPNPYQSQYPPGYQQGYMMQMGPPSSHVSSQSSVFGSPTSTTFPLGAGQQLPPGEDWRRRTWHASTYPAGAYNYGRPATSGLAYSQTPDAQQPAHAQHATAAAGQAPRLPGIESFDHMQHRSYTPPRRQTSPMLIDPALTSPAPGYDSRAGSGHASWDGSRPSQYPELDDRGQPIGAWGQQTLSEIQNVGVRMHDPSRHDMGPPSHTMMTANQHQQMAREALEGQPSVKRTKRQAWYGGPTPTRTSPEDSSSSEGVPTPGMTVVEVNPMIMPSSGLLEHHHGPLHSDAQQNVCLAPAPYLDERHHHTGSFGDSSRSGGDMNRLEALVAVATSGENVAR